MTCLSCRGQSSTSVCADCLRSLRPAPERILGGGLLVRSAFEHTGAARALVHRLKYEAVDGVATRLATVMAPLLPADAHALVPVPRATVRHLAIGVDPARALAAAVGDLVGLPVVLALIPPVWVRPRAGGARRRRGGRRFRRALPTPDGAVLVDDVVTTGTTLVAAGRACGIRRAITATSGRSALTRLGGAT